MRRDRERVLTAGFAGYLEKPISVREFPAQVRTSRPAARTGRVTTDDATVLVVDDLRRTSS